MSNNKKVVIHLVETPKGCFITDCPAVSGYSYVYHNSEINHLYFDGELPEQTFAKHWYRIRQYPKKVERIISQYGNQRYELKDKSFECEKFPLVIMEKDASAYSESVLEELYQYKHDKLPPLMVSADVEIQTVLTLDKYEEPSFNFKAIRRTGWDDSTYQITTANLKHQLFDKLFFPEVCLAHVPCALTSKQLYDITRQHVLENIDPAVAQVTSNYDFCFAVSKIIPKVEPEEVTYQNLFARTKRERDKIRTSVKEYTEHRIFSMTSEDKRYQGYPIIPGMTADSEAALRDKVQEWLDSLMTVINKPLTECECCNGRGFVDEIKKVRMNFAGDKDE